MKVVRSYDKCIVVRWGGGKVGMWEVGELGGEVGREEKWRGGELKCYIHSDIHTYIQTYRTDPLTKLVGEGL